MQSSLDAILELVEDKLNEGDYLTISNHLKTIYDHSHKKAPRIHVAWSDDQRRRPPDAFAMVEERPRPHQQYQREINELQFYIDDAKGKLACVVAAKKRLWTMSRDKSYCLLAKQDYRREHKEMCAVEKEIRLTLREFAADLEYNRMRLADI
jgi:hypothetical protein